LSGYDVLHTPDRKLRRIKIQDGGKILRVEQDMEETKIKRWSKIIAAWTLLGAIFGTVFLIYNISVNYRRGIISC
jgi:hypothetical protein